jgi:hypothetical protein
VPHLYQLFQKLHAYWWLVPIIVLAVLNIRDFWRGTTLMSCVLYRPLSGRARATFELGRIFIKHPWLFLSWSKETRFRAARLFVEVKILNPKGPAPNPHDFSDKASFREARLDWTKGEAARRRHTAAYIREQLAEERSSFYSRLWEFCRRVIPARRRLHSEGSRPAHFVPVSSFASLDESRPLIKRYFSVLASLSETDTTFVSTTQIDIGYVAPLFLITGLINRFKDEDGWKLVIDNYRKLVEHDRDYSEELRELRAFLFNCWLLWGPSIPPCSCELWRPRRKDRQSDLTVQYGFGDENNSLDLVIRQGLSPAFLRDLQLELNPVPGSASRGLGTPVALCAVPYTATGRFGWGPHLADDDLPPAQRMIQGGSGELGLRDPNRGRVFLQCDRRDCEIREISTSARYYSSYLWIIFVLLDGNGQPFYSADPHSNIESWKNLLCYFEHGNIADATTYQTLKENLIAKCCSSLQEILQRNDDTRLRPDGNGSLKIAYACAFDDSNCGPNHGVLCPPAEIFSQTGVGRQARLIDIFGARVGLDGVLGAARGSGRLLLPEGPRPRAENPFSSCHLPEMIELFYRELKGVAEPPS